MDEMQVDVMAQHLGETDGHATLMEAFQILIPIPVASGLERSLHQHSLDDHLISCM